MRRPVVGLLLLVACSKEAPLAAPPSSSLPSPQPTVSVPDCPPNCASAPGEPSPLSSPNWSSLLPKAKGHVHVFM